MKKSSFGYEMKAKGMKQMHECVKNMTNVTKTSHLGMKKTMAVLNQTTSYHILYQIGMKFLHKV
jgi:hypothetical protein